ncbi:MAG: hypothetical protein GY940_30985 [bacterium]|nr:hypothetical protein [bacterium]
MKKVIASVFGIVLLFIFVTVGTVPIHSERSSDRYLEVELKRIEEAYRLLDRFAEKIWPGWDNFNDLEIRVEFPNKVQLLINPRGVVPEGFKKIHGRIPGGKSIFINREKEVPEKLVLPLVVGRARGGLILRVLLRQLKLPATEIERYKVIEKKLKDRKKEEAGFDIAPQGDSDDYILMYAHECFHGFQSKVGLVRWGDGTLKTFKVNAGYAAYSNIEGMALKNAYYKKDHARALEYLKDFLVAREMKQAFMPPQAALNEQFLSVLEGIPSYVSLKMAMFIRDTDYKPGIRPKDDPFFFNFKYVDGFIESILKKGLHFMLNLTFDKRGKFYLYGAYQCLILDRFVPEWKREFFHKKESLDKVMANFLKLSPEEKKQIAGRLKTKYPYDALYAKHDAVIKKESNE